MAWSSEEDSFLPGDLKIAQRRKAYNKPTAVKTVLNDGKRLMDRESLTPGRVFSALVEQRIHEKDKEKDDLNRPHKTLKPARTVRNLTPIRLNAEYDNSMSDSANRKRLFLKKIEALSKSDIEKQKKIDDRNNKRKDPFYITTSESDSNTEESLSEDELQSPQEKEKKFTIKYVFPRLHLLNSITKNEKALEDISINSGTDENIEISKYILLYLREHQVEGVKWMYEKLRSNNGCILNDDMGLGKTIQIIALLASLYHKTGTNLDKRIFRILSSDKTSCQDLSLPTEELRGLNDIEIAFIKKNLLEVRKNSFEVKKTLILVPASLIKQWCREINTWCYFKVSQFPDLNDIEEEIEFTKRILSNQVEILIMSYDLFKRNWSKPLDTGKMINSPSSEELTLLSLLNNHFSLLVMDEVHCLRNPKSALTKAVKSIQIKHKIGLTGTLFQNNYRELHTLLDLINPSCLNDWREFKSSFASPIINSTKKNASDIVKEIGKQRSRVLRAKINDYVLRRDKSILHSNLPKKYVFDIFLKLSDYQLSIYKQITETVEVRALIDKVAKTDLQKGLLWKKYHESPDKCKKCPNCLGFPLLIKFQQIVNHVDLLKNESKDYQKQIGMLGSDIGLKLKSQKTEVLLKLLKIWKREGHKILIFSHSTEMLNLVQKRIEGKRYVVQRFDGSMTKRLRDENVRKFQDSFDSFVFLLSTKAGAVGLNLTSADIVVNLDPSWNPSYDLQSQDRAFRIGQTKDVKVYRFFSVDTIEQQIYVRQRYKNQISSITFREKYPIIYFDGFDKGAINENDVINGIQLSKQEEGSIFGLRNLLIGKESDAREAFKILIKQSGQLNLDNAKSTELICLRENGAEVVLLSKSTDVTEKQESLNDGDESDDTNCFSDSKDVD